MRRALALALLSLIPVFPAALPGAEAYLDNPSHLVEVREIQRILVEDGWFSGWSTRANAGMAVNQVNAPLVWTAVAALGTLFGTVPVYLAGVFVANVVFTLGAYRLFRRFLEADAAFLGAALAALAPQDLWGFAGAAGGMWPHRLANGILLAGLGTPGPVSAGKIGLWLALVLLCHTYSGMDAAGIVGIAILTGAARFAARRGGVAGGLAPPPQEDGTPRYVLGATLGALLSAPFWVPLLEGGVRPDFAGEIRFWNLADSVAEIVLPLSPTRLNRPWEYVYLGGPLNFAWSVLLLAGLWGAWTARDALRERLRPLGRWPLVAGPLFLAGMLVVVTVIVPVTLTEAFGPNPWRHLTLARTALCGLSGAGLVALGYGVRSAVTPLLVAIAAVGAYAGAREMRLPTDPETAALHADLRATWADLAAAAPTGRVYHQNTSFRTDVPYALRQSEIGALLAVETDLPVVGTWYAISAVASEPHMRSSSGGLFGDEPQRWYRDPTDFFARADAFGLGAFVAVEPLFDTFLRKRLEVRSVGAHGPFSAYVRTEPAIGPVACPDTLGCADATEARGRVEVTVAGATAETTLGVRQTWHPWWAARLDGTPVPTAREEGTGLLVVTVPARAAGRLVVTWEDPTRWTAWLSLVGVVACVVAWRRPVTVPLRRAA